jgi:hypothetical protein
MPDTLLLPAENLLTSWPIRKWLPGILDGYMHGLMISRRMELRGGSSCSGTMISPVEILFIFVPLINSIRTKPMAGGVQGRKHRPWGADARAGAGWSKKLLSAPHLATLFGDRLCKPLRHDASAAALSAAQAFHEGASWGIGLEAEAH